MEDNIRGGDEAVEVDEDGATTTGECWEHGGEPAAPPRPASVDDGRCPRSPASSEWGECLERDDKPPRIMPLKEIVLVEMARMPMVLEISIK